MLHRRKFITSTATAGFSTALFGPLFWNNRIKIECGDVFKIGIIGLDTSQVTMISTHINDYGEDWDVVAREWGTDLEGFRIVAAYPYGSRTIKSSFDQIPLYIQRMEEMGVHVTESIDELLQHVDGVMLMTFDGNLRLDQSLQVIESGKPLFINKPFAASLYDVLQIINESKKYNTPVFSSSPTRYLTGAQSARKGDFGEIIGASTYSGAPIEPTHADFYWYGIHGIEILFTIMGPSCNSVQRTSTEHTDVVIGEWDKERLGTYRGIRKGSRTHSGIVFTSTGIYTAGEFSDVGHRPLVVDMLEFFKSGHTPVSLEETLAIHVFMEAADESKRRGGAAVKMEETLFTATRR